MVQVIDHTNGWDGGLQICSTVERLLGFLSVDQLGSLESVFVTRHELQPHSRRRHKTRSRGRKIPILGCAGLYHQSWAGRRAWIELFADSITPSGWPRWVLRRRVMQNAVVGAIFFHEVGHHLHSTRAPEHREREDVAEKWSSRLLIPFLKREHSWFHPLMLGLKWSGILRVLQSKIRQYEEHRAA